MEKNRLSTRTLAKLTFPLFSLMIVSMRGVNILHGPHHVAKKSTTTGDFAFKTLSSKSFSSLKRNFVIKISSENYIIYLNFEDIIQPASSRDVSLSSGDERPREAESGQVFEHVYCGIRKNFKVNIAISSGCGIEKFNWALRRLWQI
jgi:hypothetical protein